MHKGLWLGRPAGPHSFRAVLVLGFVCTLGNPSKHWMLIVALLLWCSAQQMPRKPSDWGRMRALVRCSEATLHLCKEGQTEAGMHLLTQHTLSARR